MMTNLFFLKHTACIAATILTLCAGTSAADNTDSFEPTAQQIVDKANQIAYYQGSDGRARVSMTIVDSQNRRRQRELTILRWDQADPDKKDDSVEKKDENFAGKQKFYVYFNKPADVDKMTYLVWKNPGSDDDRWLYLPGVDLVKRIAGSEKRTSFVGSEFFYEDISGRGTTLDTHELLDTSKDYFVIKSTPKDKKTVEFAYYKTWIHRSTFLVIRQEYYNDQNTATRRYDARQVKQIDGYWTTTASRMSDLTAKRYTDLIYSDVAYNTGVPEDIFTERYLRNAPHNYLNVK